MRIIGNYYDEKHSIYEIEKLNDSDKIEVIEDQNEIIVKIYYIDFFIKDEPINETIYRNAEIISFDKSKNKIVFTCTHKETLLEEDPI